jgi:hypothetical protein
MRSLIRTNKGKALIPSFLEALTEVFGETAGGMHWSLCQKRTLLEQGRYGEAEPLYLRTLPARERLLGSEHPDTLISLNNLAHLYETQGRRREAEELFLRAVTGAEKVLGWEHPNTKTYRANLELLRAGTKTRE